MSTKPLIPIDDQMSAATFWTDIIETHSTPGDVVLVPFADDVTIAGAALELGRRVILFVRTPAQRLRLWGGLVRPDDPSSRSALARLASTTKRDTLLDRHINSLYQTACPDCGEPTPATAFIWDPARQSPVEKELACAVCGFQGRALADDADVKRAAQIERRGLSFWFILEWLVDVQDTLGRDIARRYLDEYSPRNLMALADITRKIDAELSDDPASQRLLRLWLLHALDAGRQQPDAVDGSRIVERNVWHLLTHAPAPDETDVPVRLTSDLEAFFLEYFDKAQYKSAPAPSVALVAGPIRQLTRRLLPKSVKLVLGAPPTLDADAWIWEQLWSRWIFGRGSAVGLQPPIGGWARHVRALDATMAILVPALRADGRVIFQFRDGDPDRAAALLTAMAPYATLEDFVYRPPLVEPANLFEVVGGAYHMVFTPAQSATLPPALDPPALAEAVESAAVGAGSDLIRARAEPLPYGWIVTAAMVRLAQSGLLHQASAGLDADTSPLAFVKQHVRQSLRAALAEGLLTPVVGDEPTHWWVPEPLPEEPLSERVEQTVLDLLSREPMVTPAEVYRRFSGWLTPEAELVEALLLAYGEEIRVGTWGQRPTDQAEQQAIRDALHRLGTRLGFSVGAGIADVVWGEGGHATHAFRIVETGRWSELGIEVLPDSVAGYLVLPDRMVSLLRAKIVRNPLWRRELADRRWALVKAQHLLAMAGAADVDRQEFKKIVGLDPIIEQAEAQIPLF
ncbi:MAG: hypothetical protein ACE5LU_16650 [Anaerolineae bacterium]